MLREIEKREKERLGPTVESQLSSLLLRASSFRLCGESPKVSRDHLPAIPVLFDIDVRLITQMGTDNR